MSTYILPITSCSLHTLAFLSLYLHLLLIILPDLVSFYLWLFFLLKSLKIKLMFACATIIIWQVLVKGWAGGTNWVVSYPIQLGRQIQEDWNRKKGVRVFWCAGKTLFTQALKWSKKINVQFLMILEVFKQFTCGRNSESEKSNTFWIARFFRQNVSR